MTILFSKQIVFLKSGNSVCAAINPFNAGVGTFSLKAAPCLATGNVLIVKPSEKSPLGSLAFAALFEEAGFPKGVVQVITGLGDTGALLAKHMNIQKVCCEVSILGLPNV